MESRPKKFERLPYEMGENDESGYVVACYALKLICIRTTAPHTQRGCLHVHYIKSFKTCQVLFDLNAI